MIIKNKKMKISAFALLFALSNIQAQDADLETIIIDDTVISEEVSGNAEPQLGENLEEIEVIDSDNTELEEVQSEEAIFKEKLLKTITDEQSACDNNILQNNYSQALVNMENAVNAANQYGDDTKIKELNSKINFLYLAQAKYLIQKGNAEDITRDINNALTVLDKVKGHDAEVAKLRDISKKSLKSIKYKKETSIDFLDPKKEDRLYSLRLNVSRGAKAYEIGDYDKAVDFFEAALALNMTSMDAIEGKRKALLKMRTIGQIRKDVSRAERVTEINWKAVTPLQSRIMNVQKASVQKIVIKESASEKLEKKLSEMIIDKISFNEIKISTAIKFLQVRSRQLDPDKQGVNIFLKLKGGSTSSSDSDELDEAIEEEESDEPTVTMMVNNVSVKTAIDFICTSAKLQYRIEEHAVVIADPSIALDKVTTRIYPLEKDAVSGVDDMKTFFTDRGITFPVNAGVVYLDEITRLVATNTPKNLQKMEVLLRTLNIIDPQVLIETKFIEVAQNDLTELGFAYTWTKHSTMKNGVELLTPELLRSAGSKTTIRNLDADGIGPLSFGITDNFLNITEKRHNNVRGTLSRIQNIDADINALNQLDSSDKLFCPRITARNGEVAKIYMVRDVYFPDTYTERDSVLDLVEGVDADGNKIVTATTLFANAFPQFADQTSLGIQLEVEPRINFDNDNSISLNIKPVMTEFVKWDKYGTEGIDFDNDDDFTSPGDTFPEEINKPVISKRMLSTEVTVYDGETVLLGGLLKDRIYTREDQYPILGDLPLVGRLFQSKAQYSEKTNLLIFLTCTLLHPDGSPIKGRERRGLPPFRH